MKLVAMVALTACGMSATQVRERELCYSKAEAKAQERVDRECSASFSTCPVARDILDGLRKDQEACP